MQTISTQGIKLLLSQFITLKQFTNYAILNLAQNLLPELSSIQKESLYLINEYYSESN